MLLTAAFLYLVVVGIVMISLAIAASDPTVDAEWSDAFGFVEPWQTSDVTELWPQDDVAVSIPLVDEVLIAS